MYNLDSIDQQLINLLADNARTPVAVLAKKMKVARTTVNNRLERLERNNIIERYTLKLSSQEYRQWLTATVLVQTDQDKISVVFTQLKKIPQITKIVTLSGRSDLMLTLKVATAEILDSVLDDISRITGVVRSETFIQLSTKLDRESL
ncbi:Lrp/AsnC family transcriptional regulator [Gammaproteobacteria bacterium AS21]|jgi:DNA-binding Lrp family transcriptional regulator